MQNSKRTILQGAVAGLLGAAVFAVLFLAIDLIRNRPLYTPAFMASTLLGRPTVEIDPALVAGYTVLHFGSFALVGGLFAWLLQRTGIRPYLLLGAVLGFLLFDFVFYLGIILGGTNIVNRLGWPPVLVGNILAGLALVMYLRTRAQLPTTTLRERFATQRVFRESIISGLIGASVIALWFLILDAIRGQLFFTPAALGSVLFLGAHTAAGVQITFGIVFGYSILHLTAFLVAGFLAATLFNEAERHPPVLLGIVLLFVTFEVFFFGLLVIVANWLTDVLSAWTVITANILAAIGMGVYLLRRHPVMRDEIEQPLEDEPLTR